nr:MAG TPA: homing endonuclease [Caudoviricetes sp.]
MRITLECKDHTPSKERFFVHRLVAIHFLSNPNNLPEVNHKDLNRENNRVENLEWVTHLDNERHSRINGEKPYKPFKVLFKDGHEATYEVKNQLANELGVSKTLVKYWLQNKINSYYKYGITKIYYI